MKPFGVFALLVRGLVWMVSAGVLTLLLASGAASRLDDALYDLHMKHWQYAPSDDVVIVAIDPKSMDTLGAWPWPRSVHGRLIDRLTDLGVSAIGSTIGISSPDTSHPENDRLLAQAIRRNGRVVMPVVAEASESGKPLHARLPIPEVGSAAASLGEAFVIQDPDGITRGVYLQVGLSRPYWPALAFAVYLLDHPEVHARLRGKQDDPNMDGDSHYFNEGDDYVLLRYAGPTGTFVTVSYVDVLNGNVDPRMFKGKTALLGTTVRGFGDEIFTPGLRPNPPLPVIEYQANVLESLRHGLLITPLDFTRNFLFGVMALAFPLLIYGWPGLRRMWVVAAISVALTLLASLLMLRLTNMWWPPVSVVLIVVSGSIAWSVLEPKLKRERSAGLKDSSGQSVFELDQP